MTGRRRILLVGVLLVAGTGVFLVLGSREPTYQGKQLSAWLADFDSGSEAKCQFAAVLVKALDPQTALNAGLK